MTGSRWTDGASKHRPGTGIPNLESPLHTASQLWDFDGRPDPDGSAPRPAGGDEICGGTCDDIDGKKPRNSAKSWRRPMDLGLRGKSALVCAGSKGIGRACAEALSAEGARVAICARDEETLFRAAAEISSATLNPVLPLRADLARAEDVDALFEEI